jgi:hypothetical protein
MVLVVSRKIASCRRFISESANPLRGVIGPAIIMQIFSCNLIGIGVGLSRHGFHA